MTLVRPCVLPSFYAILSRKSYIFHRIKIYKVIYYDIRCAGGFGFLNRPFFMELRPLQTQTLSQQLLPHFYPIDSKLRRMFHHDLKLCM